MSLDTHGPQSHKRIQSASATLGAELRCLAIQEEALSLELSSKDTYEEVSRQLAAALRPPLDDPLKLRFTQQNNYSQQPKPQAMRFPTQEQDLPDMLHHFGQTTDTLFYEVLDLPLPQLERLKTLKASLSPDCRVNLEVAMVLSCSREQKALQKLQRLLPGGSCDVLSEARYASPCCTVPAPEFSVLDL